MSIQIQSNKHILCEKLLNMDEAVEIGGFRQWLEEGNYRDIVLFDLVFSRVNISTAPKTIKVIQKITSVLKGQRLDKESSLLHVELECSTCGGSGILDDQVSTCPVCGGEGLIWSGALANLDNLLNTISEMYQKIPVNQRNSDIQSWCRVGPFLYD